MITGKVKFFLADKGYGFITIEEGNDVFVHVTALQDDVQSLEEGQEVTFEIVDGERGKQAANVRLV
ncbi:MAG: cold-shock protein [Erysipelothrix sp.]|nr:cold-shock protein [Erysipelothrix sp.]